MHNSTAAFLSEDLRSVLNKREGQEHKMPLQAEMAFIKSRSSVIQEEFPLCSDCSDSTLFILLFPYISMQRTVKPNKLDIGCLLGNITQ